MEKKKSIVVDLEDWLFVISSQISGKSIWILYGAKIPLNPKSACSLIETFHWPVKGRVSSGLENRFHFSNYQGMS